MIPRTNRSHGSRMTTENTILSRVFPNAWYTNEIVVGIEELRIGYLQLAMTIDIFRDCQFA